MRGSADHTTHTTSLRTVATRALRRRLLVASLLVAALVGAGCSGDDAGDDQADAGVELDGTIELAIDDAGRCEHFDAGGCMLPFPSDHFTVADDQSPERAPGGDGLQQGVHARRSYRRSGARASGRRQPSYRWA
jgi:hypothetical protein